MAKKDWLIYKIDDTQLILTDDNEKSIKAILFDQFHPYTMIDVLDYLTGNLIESLTLYDLYGEKTS